MVDGMPIINGSGQGGLQYGNYLNNSLAQEITFQTGGNSAEFERASVMSNFIPKEGSNLFRGSFDGRFTNQSLESNNLDATQISPGAEERQPRQQDLGHQPRRRRPDHQGPDVDLRRLSPLGHLQQRRRLVQGRELHREDLQLRPGRGRELHDGAEPVPGVAPERGGPSDDAGVAEEQGEPLLRLAVHRLRQLLRAELPDGDQRVPGVQEHPAVHRPGQLELAGQQQAAARGRRHADRAGLPRLPPARRAGRRSSRSPIRSPPPGMPSTWGSSTPPTAPTAATRSNYRASASYVTGSHSHEGRHDPDAPVALHDAGGEQLGLADAAQRPAVLAHRVRDADSVPRDRQLQHGPVRAGSVDDQAADGRTTACASTS